MANPQPTLLAHLPGYDTSPDIYETPEPASTSATGAGTADETSSSASTVHRGRDGNNYGTSEEEDESETSSDGGGDDDDDQEDDGEEDSAVVRRRLHPSRARDRFAAGAGRVRTRGVDLSERVDGGRKGYRVSRGARVQAQRSRGGAGIDEDEGLEARIARLRVEVEECRVLASKDEQAEGKDGKSTGDEVDGLSRLLGELETQRTRRPGLIRASSEVPGTYPAGEEDRKTGVDEEADVPLGRIAEFDGRLAVLEQALGLSALEMESTSTTSTPPLLPSLTLLDQQMSVLTSSSSIAGLDALATRVRNIRREADETSSPATNATTSPTTTEGEEQNGSAPTLSKEDTTNLHALYSLLPTIQSLAPTVPALLSRLRSLRTLHGNAAQAASELDEVEKRQQRMASDLQGWREGLEKVEAAVREASEANGRNGKVVEGWVKEVEGRVKGLGR